MQNHLFIAYLFIHSVLNGFFSPLSIGVSSICPPERELIAVSSEVLPADMVKSAVNASLEQGKIGFSGVRIDIPSDIFLLGVVHDLMTASILKPHSVICTKFVRNDPALRINDFPHSGLEGIGINAVYGLGNDSAVSFDHSEDGGFLCSPSSLGRFFRFFGFSTDVGFIHFNLTGYIIFISI